MGYKSTTPVDDSLLEAMADAMLDPDLIAKGYKTSRPGNDVRAKVLLRALQAASGAGYELRKIRQERKSRDSIHDWQDDK